MSAMPLEGIKVADFGQFIAGPAVGQALAEMGADVVKVEPLSGDACRSAGKSNEMMLLVNNRGKRSLAVDLREPRGLAVGERLLASSDVVIQNMRPGTMSRLGLGPERAQELNPKIVYLSVTAFGKGADPKRAGLDIAAQAESGIMSITGEADRDPQRVGFTVVDAATSYAATNAVLGALFRRERTGQGALIDTSLLEVAIHMQGPTWLGMFLLGNQPRRCGNGQPQTAPAAEVVTVKDGQIVLSAYTPEHWKRLCEAIGRPDLPDDPRFATNAARLENRAEMGKAISDALQDLSLAEAVEFLGARGIVAGAIRNHQQVLESKDVQRMDLFPETQPGGLGTYRHPARPYNFRDLERPHLVSAPRLGQHSREVVAGLGYLPTEIDQLVSEGVIDEGATG